MVLGGHEEEHPPNPDMWTKVRSMYWGNSIHPYVWLKKEECNIYRKQMKGGQGFPDDGV